MTDRDSEKLMPKLNLSVWLTGIMTSITVGIGVLILRGFMMLSDQQVTDAEIKQSMIAMRREMGEMRSYLQSELARDRGDRLEDRRTLASMVRRVSAVEAVVHTLEASEQRSSTKLDELLRNDHRHDDSRPR